MHARAHNCVERCIGLLKARFRCILGEKVLKYEPHKVGIIINACAILHNLCLEQGMEFEIPDYALGANAIDAEAVIEPIVDVLDEGRHQRRNIINRYFT